MCAFIRRGGWLVSYLMTTKTGKSFLSKCVKRNCMKIWGKKCDNEEGRKKWNEIRVVSTSELFLFHALMETSLGWKSL